MKTSIFWQTPLISRGSRFLYLLHLVSMITGLSSAHTGHMVTYEGVVGGNISLYCPVDKPVKLKFLYFQKVVKGEDIFLNGYHSRKPLNLTSNTKMDRNYTIMHMYELQLSDSGKYQCHYMYEDSPNTPDPIKVEMHLDVRAIFSTPVITINCNEGSGIPSECHVKCDSYNGLPGKEIMWKVPGNISRKMWKILKNEEKQSNTELVNISSTAYFNCSGGEVMVSCSADGFTSNISVCSLKAPPDQPDKFSTVVVVALVICSLVIVLSLIWGFRKRATGTNKGSVQNMAENGQPEEVIVLNNIPG